MNRQEKLHDFCKTMLVWALVFRLCIAGVPETLLTWLTQPNTAAFLIYLETGQNVRFSSSSGARPVFWRESAPPRAPEPEKPGFSEADLELVKIRYLCSFHPDLKALLTQPLNWNLKTGEPAVLILHTHGTESYTQTGEDYVETSAYRTLEEACNMLSIGDRVAGILEENGIAVIHDREYHDYPSYNGSYTHARKSIQAILEEYPSIRMILDLHRDATGSVEKQLRTEVSMGDNTCAQLMLVMGSHSPGLTHKNWEQNLSLALKLHVLLEQTVPGIMRPIQLRAQRFNQDLCAGALLIEVGAAGNTHAEALLAAEQLAQAVVSLSKGTATAPEA